MPAAPAASRLGRLIATVVGAARDGGFRRAGLSVPLAPNSSLMMAAAQPLGGASAVADEGLVAGHGADDCIFCKIRDGAVPSHKLLETEHALAFLDAFPMARGHSLLIPKKHHAFLSDMPPDEAAGFLGELPRLVAAVAAATGAAGVNVAQNNGAAAGQVVFHVHFHVLPRSAGDGLVRFAPSGAMIAPDVAAEIRQAITTHLPPSE
eukprot:SM000007S20837  [mRNA]  locus=s7:516478:517098:+ [translate_table: standard]